MSDVQTRLVRSGDGYLLSGRKFYSSGALFAHWIPVVAKDEDDHTVIAFVDRNAKGLTVIDDWSSFGQRTTASGTTVLESVEVSRNNVVPHYLAFERPTTMGAVAQIIQAAVDVGIASAAFKDTTSFVRTRTRPWVDSGVELGSQDPLTVFHVGELAVRAFMQRKPSSVGRVSSSTGHLPSRRRHRSRRPPSP